MKYRTNTTSTLYGYDWEAILRSSLLMAFVFLVPVLSAALVFSFVHNTNSVGRSASVSSSHSAITNSSQPSLVHSLIGMFFVSKVEPAPEIELPDSRTSEISPGDGMRAVSLPVNSTASVEGLALPGTYVDVIFTYVDRDLLLKSSLITQRAKVLSYNLSAKQSGTRIAQRELGTTSVTLEVEPKEALKLLTAKEISQVSLALRSQNDLKLAPVDEVDAIDIEGPVNSGDEFAKYRRMYCPSWPASRAPIGTRMYPKPEQMLIIDPVFSNCFL